MPRLTLDEIKKGKHSETFRRLNPGLFEPGALDRLGAAVDRKPKRALERQAQAKRSRKAGLEEGECWCITLIAFVSRRMDDDNLAHACKPLRDAIADWLGIDDGSNRLRWQYGQVETKEGKGTVGMIERMEL